MIGNFRLAASLLRALSGLLLRVIAVLVVVIGGIGTIAGTALALVPQARTLAAAADSEPVGTLDLSPLSVRSIVYDVNGDVLASLHAEENRMPVPLETVPEPVIKTILAIEDINFYDHAGVDVRGTFRAALANVEAGGISQGGSTITQQLVKNNILSSEQDLDRKSREAVLALRLENEFTKDEILEQYLNTVYLGGGAYGVQAAAEMYWGVDVGQLDWGEAALIASLIKNPVGYDPIRRPAISLERRELVLRVIWSLGYITDEELDDYLAVPLPTDRIDVLPPPNDYFVEEVKKSLLADRRLGATPEERFDSVFRGGLEVHTTFDPEAQAKALAARDDVLPENDLGVTASIVGIEPSSGAVKAMVGGPGFENYQYNLATQGLRQPGSTFKTLVLAAAFEAGYVPEDKIDGRGPCEFENPFGEPNPYKVKNFGGSGGSIDTLENQTQRSSNCTFVLLGEYLGLDVISDIGGRAGITRELNPEIVSMPLGSIEVPPIEMAGAYLPFANGGVFDQPYLIERVENQDGALLFGRVSEERRVVTAQTACLVTDVLYGNVEGGTGKRAQLRNGRQAAGKTGTTQDSSDAWFVGYTPQLVTAVWMGSPDGRVPMENIGRDRYVTGGSYPAQMWGEFMESYHEELPELDFAECEAVREGGTIDTTGGDSPTERVARRTTVSRSRTRVTAPVRTQTARRVTATTSAPRRRVTATTSAPRRRVTTTTQAPRRSVTTTTRAPQQTTAVTTQPPATGCAAGGTSSSQSECSTGVTTTPATTTTGASGTSTPTPQPTATQPSVTQPPTTQPPATQPPTTQPPATQPPTTQPPTTQAPTTQPPATQPPTTQPPTTQAAGG